MEEYCEGDELDLDMLVQDKIIKYIGICDSVTYEPYFKENKGCFPSACFKNSPELES